MVVHQPARPLDVCFHRNSDTPRLQLATCTLVFNFLLSSSFHFTKSTSPMTELDTEGVTAHGLARNSR